MAKRKTRSAESASTACSTQKEAGRLELQVAGGAYTFKSGSIHNLDGSRNVNGVPLIRSHGDVANEAVTWAFACLLTTA